MKRYWILAVAFVVMAISAPNLRGQISLSPKYPVIRDTTSAIVKMSELGLHLDTLKDARVMLNWFENVRGVSFRHFVYDTLPANTLVYADKDEVPRYKWPCVNLLASLEECPNCPYVSTTDTLVVQWPSSFAFPDTINLHVFGNVTAPVVRDTAMVREVSKHNHFYTKKRFWVPTSLAFIAGTAACIKWCGGRDIRIRVFY